MEILHQVKIGQQGTSSSETNVIVNYAGITSFTILTIPKNSIYHFWILDSGASEHIIFDESILFNIKPLQQPVFVNLPNSFRIKVTHAG